MTCTILILDRICAFNVNVYFVSVHTVAIILNYNLSLVQYKRNMKIFLQIYFKFFRCIKHLNKLTLLFAFSKLPLALVPTLPSVRWWSRAVPFASVPLVLTFIFAVVGWHSGHHHEADDQQDDQKLGLQQYGSETDLVRGRSST